MSVAFWVGGKMRGGGGNDDLTTEACYSAGRIEAASCLIH